MKRLAIAFALALAGFAGLDLEAARSLDFQARALDEAMPANLRRSTVFSPISFEIDAAIFGGSMDAIARAAVAETIGTLGDFANAYQLAMTNVTVARAFVLPHLNLARCEHRRRLSKSFATQVCGHRPQGAAEAYLKAAMEGEMEDFTVGELSVDRRYQFFDLLSVRVEPSEPFARRQDGDFHCADGTVAKMAFVEGLLNCSVRRYGVFSLVRIPLVGGEELFLAMPDEGVPLADIRRDLDRFRLANAFSSFRAVGDAKLAHGRRQVLLPEIDISSETSLRKLMTAFKIPTSGFEQFHPNLLPAALVQRVRVRTVTRIEESPGAKSAPNGEALRFDRPFMFFVVRQSSNLLKVAGQFTGIR